MQRVYPTVFHKDGRSFGTIEDVPLDVDLKDIRGNVYLKERPGGYGVVDNDPKGIRRGTVYSAIVEEQVPYKYIEGTMTCITRVYFSITDKRVNVHPLVQGFHDIATSNLVRGS